MTSETTPSTLAVIDVPADCGNAPRKLVLRDFFIAFYSGDVEGVTAWLKDDTEWEFVGDAVVQGTEAITQWIAETSPHSELHLHRVLTHGWQCAVEGTVTSTDGSQTRFAHVVDFTGGAKTAKIKAIRSYRIALS